MSSQASQPTTRASDAGTARWRAWFEEAGVPNDAALRYAVAFADHRIEPYMLADLTREYLHEMGIALIGHVIAILKHARHTYESEYLGARSGTGASGASMGPPNVPTVPNVAPVSGPIATATRPANDVLPPPTASFALFAPAQPITLAATNVTNIARISLPISPSSIILLHIVGAYLRVKFCTFLLM